MRRRLRRIVSWLCVLSLCLSLLPTTALAADGDGTIYSNEETGITIKVTSGNIHVEKTINFTVIVDGSTVVEDRSVEVALSTTDLNVDAAGYDVTFETTNGMTVTPGINNNYNVGLGAPYSYDCTINLASAKTRDDITIATGETVYGIFSWSKQHAGNSAYPKDIEIYVNGNYAYTQTVNTPRTLSNTVGSNQEFWFTPGEDFNPTYKMDRLTLDSVSNQELRIDLTTKCPCGRDTCLCEGGNCSCEPECECPNCMGTNLEDNQINTGYGIIEYMEPGSQGGYRLQVKINLNGTIVYTSEWFRVSVGLPGNLKFTPTVGKYFFQNPNSYDIVTLHSGSIWSEYTGQLSIVGVTQEDRNYDNILTINLVSFGNKVTLDVERRSGALTNQVIGYRVSYTLEDKEYTYDYYNFAAAQAPNIPTNVPVTITAICNSPYEVAQWSTGNAHAGNVTLKGSEGQDGTEAYGNSVTLTVNSAGDTTILLYIDNLGTVTVPDDDDLINPDTGLLKDNAVTIDCTNEKAQHSDWTYGLKSGTYTIGTLGGNSADGYTCDITVTNTVPYVTSYNTDVSDGHTLDPVDQGQKTITLKWVNGEWTVPTGEAPVTYTVKCKTGSDPGTDPDDGEISDFTKTVMTGPVTGIDGTYDYPEVKDDQNVVTITEDTTSVTLLYAITVTGTPDTQFTVTDEDATLVSSTDGSITQGTDDKADEFTGAIPTGGTITFYVSKTFTSFNEGDTLTNSATVTGGDDTEADTEEVTVEVDDGEEPNPETASYTVEYIFLDEKGVKVDDTSSWTSDDIFPKGDSDVKVGMEVYIVPPESVTGDNTDHYILVEGNYSCTISKDGPNTITVTYALDNWKDDEDGDSETGGDGTPDYQQALIQYEVEDSGGSVSPTIQVETMEQSSGSYSKEVTASSTAMAEDHYAFDYWSWGTDEISYQAELSDTFTAQGGQTYTYTAHFDTDANGDKIPDKYQVFVKFVSADENEGTVTGNGATQVFTLKDAEGNYAESGTITPVNKGITIAANSGYAFDIWTEGTGTTAVNPFSSRTVNGGDEITFYANFDKDEIGDENPDEGDGTPDKYQATVTYRIVGGTWSGGSNTDIKEVFTLYTYENGVWTKKDNVTLTSDGHTIPSEMTASEDYLENSGKWNDPAPTATTVVVNGTVYTYVFTKAAPSLVVTKSADRDSVKAGEPITYTVTVTNNGNKALTDVTVTDDMWGDEVTSITVGDSTVPVSAAGYTIQNLSVGETVTITYTYTVTADDLGTIITNHVTAKAEGEDGPEGDDTTETKVDEGELTVHPAGGHHHLYRRRALRRHHRRQRRYH